MLDDIIIVFPHLILIAIFLNKTQDDAEREGSDHDNLEDAEKTVSF